MAPTQILAEQHYKTISKLLEPFNISVGLYKQSQRTRRNSTVGTHALLEKILHLIMSDLLLSTNNNVLGYFNEISSVQKERELQHHIFTMTATPIPRTLALTLYGNPTCHNSLKCPWEEDS